MVISSRGPIAGSWFTPAVAGRRGLALRFRVGGTVPMWNTFRASPSWARRWQKRPGFSRFFAVFSGFLVFSGFPPVFLAETLGAMPEDIKPEAHLVRDLGAG
jgi:hypothetical protein